MTKEEIEAEIAKERQLMLDSIMPGERRFHAERIADLDKQVKANGNYRIPFSDE